MPHVYTNTISQTILSGKLVIAFSTDREREMGGHEERERERERERGCHEETDRGILPVRSVDQRFVESIRVTTAQPIRISLGFSEHL